MKKIKVFEAFAGYGSQSIALENIGANYKVVGISEIDPYAIKGYYALHDESIPNFGDISKINPKKLPKFDLFTYSFPCQSISISGLQHGIIRGQTRSGLLYECERIIEYCEPKYLLLENVKNLVGKKFKPDFLNWLDYLESLGYKNYWKVLNAKNYGIPQSRERVFVVSILGEDEFKFPDTIPLTTCMRDYLDENVDTKYYFTEDKLEKFVPNHNFTHTVLDVLQNNKVDKISAAGELDVRWRNQLKRVYFDNGCCPTLDTMAGGNREPKLICIGFIDKNYQWNRVYDNIGCIRTLTASDDGNPPFIRVDKNILPIELKNNILDLDPYITIRKLTPVESLRLMGLNNEQIKKMVDTGLSNSRLYKMAGNSIVVPVLEAIFRELFNIKSTKKQ